jgi:HAMP domain-containing protein
MGISSGEPRNQRRLRSLLIEPFAQIKFGLYMISCAIVFITIILGFFLYSFYVQYQQVMDIFHIVDPQVKWELILNNVFYANAAILAGIFLVFFATFFAIVIRETHKYYGPLVSINRFVRELKGGTFTSRVRIRKDDELQGLARELNELAEYLEKTYHQKP